MNSKLNALETLLDCLKFYDIPVQEVKGNFVTVKGYEIELEANGLYKLFSDGSVIAPFDDLDELCRFILA